MPMETTSSPATRSEKETAMSAEAPTDFIRAIIREDVKAGKNGGRVVTRFPPEPNGYLHIGHAKSICLNFGVAEEFGGRCNLRFDDTDPAKEDATFVEAIKDDVRWLGFSWGDGLFNASDYFGELYRLAMQLIERGNAFVCSLSEEEIRQQRGTVTQPGRESPYRSRPVAENLDLFRRMRAGEFPDGAHVLRAKIDMASPNMKMRDPVIYRIRHVTHHRTGDAWPIYPMYDFAHPLSDALEGITHSLCTLEFENNREFYDWILEQVDVPSQPRQIEFARLNLNYTVMSKRKLLQLVKEKHVRGWDDPRMPTIAGLRRRGYTPEAIRDFCRSVGIAKSDSVVDIGQLEYFIRNDLNQQAPRTLCVLRPLKVVIENYPEGKTEELEAPFYPHDVPKEGARTVPLSREIYIESDDFLEDPPRKYYRLAPGREVRLRYAYIIRCERVLKDPKTGEVTELRASYDPASRSGADTSGKKVQGTIHWVSVNHARPAEIRLYDRLFSVENPDADGDKDFRSYLNPESLVMRHGFVEPSLADARPGARYQFERQGYFYADPDSKPDRLVFNRIVTLRDSWAKLSQPAEATRKRRRARRQSETRESESGQKPEKPRAAAPAVTLANGQQKKLATYEKLGLAPQDALLLVSDGELDAFFEEILRLHPRPKSVANWVVNELRPELKGSPIASLPFGANELAELVALEDDGVISRAGAREVFTTMMAEGGGAPREIVERKGLQQLTDTNALEPIIDSVIAAHPENVERYRQGKTSLLGLFVKEVLTATSGKANPRLVNELLRSKLS